MGRATDLYTTTSLGRRKETVKSRIISAAMLCAILASFLLWTVLLISIGTYLLGGGL
jgi:hypothetical protein